LKSVLTWIRFHNRALGDILVSVFEVELAPAAGYFIHVTSKLLEVLELGSIQDCRMQEKKPENLMKRLGRHRVRRRVRPCILHVLCQDFDLLGQDVDRLGQTVHPRLDPAKINCVHVVGGPFVDGPLVYVHAWKVHAM
jgi:hypothetical protein